MSSYDCGIITAFRNKYTHEENMDRNRKLIPYFLSWGYGVTSVFGSYIEDYNTPNQKKEQKEVSYFVTDIHDKGKLEKALMVLAKKFDQDSILFLPKNDNRVYLLGTSSFEGRMPLYKSKTYFDKMKIGKPNEFMAKVKGRPFYFESVGEKINPPEGMMGKMYLSKMIEKEVDNQYKK